MSGVVLLGGRLMKLKRDLLDVGGEGMKRIVRIFPYEAGRFEVVVEDGEQVVYDLIVDQVEMHDGEGVLVVETDGDVFVLSAYEYDRFLKGFNVLN